MIHSGKADPQRSGTKKRWVRRSFAVVGLIAIIGIIWLCAAQKNNLKALYLAMTSDADILEQKRVEEEKKQEDILQQYGLAKPESTQDQQSDETDGNEANSPEQSLPSSGGSETSQTAGQTESQESDQDTNQAAGQESDQDTNQAAGQESDQGTDPLQAELQGYINQLYQVEARYQQSLDEMVESTKKEFWSLPKDQQVNEKKMAIVKSKMNDLIAQEKACDAEVETILSNIEDVLKRQGKSNDLVNSIRSYYEESKATWKAAKMTELYS